MKDLQFPLNILLAKYIFIKEMASLLNFTDILLLLRLVDFFSSNL